MITPPTPFAEQIESSTLTFLASSRPIPEKLSNWSTKCSPLDFLNMFFQSIYKPIPLDYNLVLAMLWRHPENVDLDNVKVVHYCAAGSKPWRYTGKEANMDREDIKMLVTRWWDIYNDKSLDLKHRDYTVIEKDTISIIGLSEKLTLTVEIKDLRISSDWINDKWADLIIANKDIQTCISSLLLLSPKLLATNLKQLIITSTVVQNLL